MTSAQRRTIRQVEEELRRVTHQRDQLLDIVNVLLAHEGGTQVIPDVEVLAATRHEVDVFQRPGWYTFRLVGYEDKPKGRLAQLLGRS